MAFLDKLDGFYGTGEKNGAGQSLEEFLAAYNPKKYDCPSNTTDIVVIRSEKELERWGQPMQVLMVRRSNHPSIGYWAVPGGFVELREDLKDGAARELYEETGVDGLPLQQLATWGAYRRDPRWRVITTSFLALAKGDISAKAGDDAADALWMDISLEALSGSANAGQEIWELRLDHEAHGIHVGAKVKITRSDHKLLPQEEYELLESDGIAVDHGCIIVQALLYIRERLKKQS